MPCTRQDQEREQQEQIRRFRTTFRTFNGIRFNEQDQDLSNFSVVTPTHHHLHHPHNHHPHIHNPLLLANHHPHHAPISPSTSSSSGSNNPEELTEQIIISVNTHITRRSIKPNGSCPLLASTSANTTTTSIDTSKQQNYVNNTAISTTSNTSDQSSPPFTPKEAELDTTSSKKPNHGQVIKLEPSTFDLEIEPELSITDQICPPYNGHRQVGVIKNYLHNGASFSGFQRSKNESYEVNVKIQYIDYENSYLCGYLCISHLTKSHPSLTTFFDGEIISKQHPFLTRKWEANEAIDRAHWSRIDGFEVVEKIEEKTLDVFTSEKFDYDELKQSDYIFMRWKEHFLVPDHTIKHVEGASYAGFYYICYSKLAATIKGYYFHINSEQFESFQSINLEYNAQGSTEAYEFR